MKRRSFKSCTWTISTDGTEDNNSHCFKADQPCHASHAAVIFPHSVRDKVKAFEVDGVVVPGNCTKSIQTPNVLLNKPFKAAVTEK